MLKGFPLRSGKTKMAANIITIQHGRSFVEHLKKKKDRNGKEEENCHYLHMLCFPLDNPKKAHS